MERSRRRSTVPSAPIGAIGRSSVPSASAVPRVTRAGSRSSAPFAAIPATPPEIVFRISRATVLAVAVVLVPLVVRDRPRLPRRPMPIIWILWPSWMASPVPTKREVVMAATVAGTMPSHRRWRRRRRRPSVPVMGCPSASRSEAARLSPPSPAPSRAGSREPRRLLLHRHLRPMVGPSSPLFPRRR